MNEYSLLGLTWYRLAGCADDRPFMAPPGPRASTPTLNVAAAALLLRSCAANLLPLIQLKALHMRHSVTPIRQGGSADVIDLHVAQACWRLTKQFLAAINTLWAVLRMHLNKNHVS